MVYTGPSVTDVTYVSSYSGVGATISGTANSVKISFSATATSVTLNVSASNGCGTSTTHTMAIILNNNGTKSDTLVVINPPVNPAALDLTNEFKVYPESGKRPGDLRVPYW